MVSANRWLSSSNQAPVVETLDSAIHWINHYPLDKSIGFASVYPPDSDLSGGERYPSFEQLRPEPIGCHGIYPRLVLTLLRAASWPRFKNSHD